MFVIAGAHRQVSVASRSAVIPNFDLALSHLQALTHVAKHLLRNEYANIAKANVNSKISITQNNKIAHMHTDHQTSFLVISHAGALSAKTAAVNAPAALNAPVVKVPH